MSNSTTATVETLTAEVRVLMVGSRQVTLSVFGQLDEVEFEQIEPFGRVRPKNDNDGYIWLVGCDQGSGALVRARIPVSENAMARAAGFSGLEYDRLAREADAADRDAKRYEADCESTWFSSRGRSGTGRELAAQCRDRATQLRGTLGAMHDKYERSLGPLQNQAYDAENLPLIVLAGLR